MSLVNLRKIACFATDGKPMYFNTAVIKKNSQFVRNKRDTGFGRAVVRGKVELGFQYIVFTGNEKKILFHGEDVENIGFVGVFANGKLISSKFENGTIQLEGAETGRKELLLLPRNPEKLRTWTPFHLRSNFSNQCRC
jgi:hypothetical protein